MKNIILFIILLISTVGFSQDVLMQNGMFNRCAPDKFFDSGGEFGDYGNNENFVITFCPQNTDEYIILNFISFSTQLNQDVMTIYDGDSTSAIQIGTYSGVFNPETVSASDTNTSGCLTIEFVTNGSASTTGWEAEILCAVSCQIITPSIDSNPSDSEGVISIFPGDSVDFTGSSVFSVDETNATFNWDFGDGNSASGTNVSNTFTGTGLYEVTLTVSDNNPQGCSESTTMSVLVLGSVITINNEAFSESYFDLSQLVEDILVVGGCSTIDNFSSQVNGTPTDLETKSYGYFTRGGASNFPFESGIVLSTGRAFEGGNEFVPPGVDIIDFNNGQSGDADLENALGIVAPDETNDATFIKFNFRATSNTIGFRYIMASEEYDGSTECLFTDSFAFLLREVGTTTYTNLAVLPDNTPVSVTNINDSSTCSANTAFFEGYNIGETNYNGRTVVLTASANVIPDTTYEIKLVIADEGDYRYDTAIFLEAGSFDLGGELGDDITIDAGTAVCSGVSVTLDTNAPTATHTWYYAADPATPTNTVVISGETSSVLSVTDPGIYSVDVVFSPACEVTDSILVEFLSSPNIDSTQDLLICDANNTVEFMLTDNDDDILGTQTATDFEITYHLTQQNAIDNVNALTSPYTNISNPQTIYARIANTSQTCYDTTSFLLTINPPSDPSFVITPTCDGGTVNITGDIGGVFSFNPTPDPLDTVTINSTTGLVTGALPEAVYTVEYTTTGTCPQTSIEELNVLTPDDASFTMTPTCDGGTANITGMPGGVFSFNPVPTDGAIIDITTGVVSGGTSNSTYTVEYLTTGQCPSSSSFMLTLIPSPIIIPPTDLLVCDDAVPDGLTEMDLTIKNDDITGNNSDYVVSYYLTLSDAEMSNSPLPTLYTNTSNGQIIYVRVEDINTSCYDITTLRLQVEQAPLAFIPTPLRYCDTDNDGFGVFTLTDADDEIRGGDLSLIVTYHETQDKALNNEDAIDITMSYSNIDQDIQILYARVESPTITTNCITIIPLELVVEDTPQVSVPEPLEICDDMSADGLAVFDLTSQSSSILNGQDPAQYVLSYYESEGDANAGTNFITNPTTYTNITAFNQTIYIRIEDVTTVSRCYKVISLDLTVNELPALVQPTPLELCDDLGEIPGDEITTFDLTEKDNEITGGILNYSVAYYETLTDAQLQQNMILNPATYTNTAVNGLPANPQDIYVVVTDTDTGCIDFTTMTIRVLPNPTPTLSAQLPELILCDNVNAGDGVEVFDLVNTNNMEQLILNGQTGVTVTYHETASAATEGIDTIPDPTQYINTSTEQTIYVRVTNTEGCYELVEFKIRVNPLPDVVAITDFIVCEFNTDGFYDFDLTTKDSEVLNGQDPSLFTVTYHNSQVEADDLMNPLISDYTNLSNPQQIFVTITNNGTGCSISTESFNLEVQEGAEANADMELIVYEKCDDNMETDGNPSNDSVQFDLSTQDLLVLDGQDPLNYTVTYFATETEANSNINPLPFLYENSINPQIVYARVDNDILDTVTGNDTTICFAVAELTLQVNPLPELDLEDNYILCVNTNSTQVVEPLEIHTNLSVTDYSFEWSYNGTTIPTETGSSIMPNQEGTYSVIVTDISTSTVTNCTSTDTTEVIESELPMLEVNLVTQVFVDSNIIEALATGIGIYEYSIDGRPWQDDGTFTNVSAGDHEITARDKNGCGMTTKSIFVIDYPLYFTPNGDGIHDTWNIEGIGSNAKIYIFDRYGKLLKQLSPDGIGWNGMINGNMMPTSDYWFMIEYNDPMTSERKEFRAHFALKL